MKKKHDEPYQPSDMEYYPLDLDDPKNSGEQLEEAIAEALEHEMVRENRSRAASVNFSQEELMRQLTDPN